MKGYRKAIRRSLLIAITLISFLANNHAQTCDRHRDSLALVALYNATDGDNWKESSNWLIPGKPIDEWFGVTVNAEGCIAEIRISSNDLNGRIPAQIGDLLEIEYLTLNSNSLNGELPVEIGNLTKLWHLSFSRNQLSGKIPASIQNLDSLQNLYFIENELSDLNIPALRNLTSLVNLGIGVNQNFGQIPSELGTLVNLESLSLSGSNFRGEIPKELGGLSSLRTLDLSRNNLSGSIPAELGNLSNLRTLFLSRNHLSGSIPAELGNIDLVQVMLSDNELSGEIPNWFETLPFLGTVFLQNNKLSGPLPKNLGRDMNIVFADLSNNNFTGELPKELALQSNIDFLDVRNNALSGCIPYEYKALCDKRVFLDNNPGLPNNGDFQAFCEFGSGGCYNINGQVVLDSISNCIKDIFEPGLRNWKIIASDGTDEYFSITRVDGTYSLFAPPGIYNIEAIPPTPIWTVLCATSSTVTVDSLADQNQIDFFTMFNENCPALEVDISTPRLRRCFDQTYTVQYCNYGSAQGVDSYITVEFDDLINIDSASIPIGNQNNNSLTFDIGLIPMNTCKTFEIYTNVSCDAVLDQTLCVEAHIYPDSLCSPVSAQWSRASIEVTDTCVNDTVKFSINNVGNGNMMSPGSFIVIEDGVVLRIGQFQLNSGEAYPVEYEGNGATYVLQADQVANHPGMSMPSAAVEACGRNSQGGFSTGFVTQFPENDADPFVSIDCQEVIGSFDPNDKHGFPKGYGMEHFINKGQEVNYHIRFQNTGTDTAFTVVIRDVLDPSLDLNTIQPGASSHSYGLDIIGDTVQFVFSNIMLPDSIVNEPASHGFLQFKINHKPNIPLGTVFENTADIYFDYNDPISTNTTYHQIGENYLVISKVQNQLFPNLEVRTSPNPFQEETRLEMDGMNFMQGKFSLFNINGVMVRSDAFAGQELIIKRNNLPSGIYMFKISENGVLAAFGKLVIK